MDSAHLFHEAEGLSHPARGTTKRTSSGGETSLPRKRHATACNVCRARKTKCDNKKPRCSYCQRIGAACDGEEVISSVHPESQIILDRIDRLEKTLLQSSWSPSTFSNVRMEVTSSDVPPHTDFHTPTVIDSDVSNKSLSFATIEGVLSWPVFGGRYDSSLDLRGLMEGSNQLSHSATRSYPNFELESCPRLLDNFFSRIHIKNPVLDEKKVRKWARDISIEGVGWDARSCLVLVLCALGTVSQPFTSDRQLPSVSSFKDSEDYNQAEAWFDASQKRIGTLLSVSGGVLEAQCFFFSGVYLMHTFRVFAAWPLFLQALASCQGFKCCSRKEWNTMTASPTISGTHEVGLSEESMYWTCFKTELETRLELSLPSFKATDLSYPAFLPSPPLESIQNQDQAWYFYLAEISLRRLANRLLAKVLPYQAGTFYSLTELAECMTTFEQEAEQWERLLPPQVDIGEDSEEDVLKFILKGHLLNCYEMTYWPFVMNAISFPTDREQSLDYLVRRGLQVCVDRIWKNKSGFHHRHHGTWGMMRSCTRSALVLVAARMSGHLDEIMPQNWESSVYAVIDLLQFWQGECGDAESRKEILQDAMGCLAEAR